MSLDVVDWRRTTTALYASVRAAADGDPASAHDLWCRGRDALLADHPASPLRLEHRASFTGLAVASYDPAFRFEAELETAEPETFEVQTGTDGVASFSRIGTARLGDLGSLDVWWLGTYGGGVFVPLRDTTAGRTTYGGGRYLLDTVKGADLGSPRPGHLVLDLNFAYNPSCAYDPAWACPLAPPGNHLTVDVGVGEQHAGPWADGRRPQPPISPFSSR
ncbi:MAG TPA: DUF1684 domain-containing protein [Actinomycetales bacterium]|nr:DUF1684 domain-containing protein [Actinomycetales bacterium]